MKTEKWLKWFLLAIFIFLIAFKINLMYINSSAAATFLVAATIHGIICIIVGLSKHASP